MSQAAFAEKTYRAWQAKTPEQGTPDLCLRLVGALLALAVAGVHVADQGGITAFTDPDWKGWAYRFIEFGGVLTALALLPRATSWLGWRAAMLLGAGPFVAYLLSRTVGIPGSSDDIGNWGDWVGTVSLVVEAALVILAVGVLLPTWHGHHADSTVSQPEINIAP